MNDLPYSSIPDFPTDYTASNVFGRMLDGLGYRYYWATQDLRQEDLNYRPSGGGRSLIETLVHICELTEGLRLVARNEVILPPLDFSTLSYESLRSKALSDLKEASNLFTTMADDKMEDMALILQSGEQQFKSPLWRVITGPLTDVAYHVGQVVSYRRSAGNPLAPGVDPFMGVTKRS
ncbi:MAG: hypothetical protein GYB31_06920 [Bacteroidetes bacterium]|nr:hypothetical protein [Bacteroidota bacterium]